MTTSTTTKLTNEQKAEAASLFAGLYNSTYTLRLVELHETLDPNYDGDYDSFEEWQEETGGFPDAPEDFDYSALDYTVKEDGTRTQELVTLTYSKDPELDLEFALQGSDWCVALDETQVFLSDALSEVTGLYKPYVAVEPLHLCERVGHNQWLLTSTLFFN